MGETGFAHLSELVRRRAGILLPVEREHATVRRLAAVASAFGFTDSEALLAELEHPREELAEAVTEAVTIRDTSFFRNPAVFSCLEREILPQLLTARAGKRRLRFWSAACATGQEAYSIAMTLCDANLPLDGWIIDLIATDISRDAIARAKEGAYSQFEIERGLTQAQAARYFSPDSDCLRARERLRRRIMFRSFNLLDHFGWLGQIDVIFCRNVLIYLAPEERSVVLDKLAGTLAPGGWLILGDTEASARNLASFVPIRGPRGVFRKR